MIAVNKSSMGLTVNAPGAHPRGWFNINGYSLSTVNTLFSSY